MTEWKLYIVDNSTGGKEYNKRWTSVVTELNDIVPSSLIVPDNFEDYSLSAFHINSGNSKGIAKALRNGEENIIFIFPNARDPLVFLLNEYRIANKLNIKILGFWNDGIFDRDSNFRVTHRSHNYNWILKYERAIAACHDLNLFTDDNYELLFKNYHSINPKTVKTKRCRFPFTQAITDLRAIPTEYGITEKADIVIMNTKPESHYDPMLFKAMNYEFPGYEFINVYESKLTHKAYLKLLASAKIVFSTNTTDSDPYQIFEAVTLGAFPIVPDIPVYKEMFPAEMLYNHKILRPPSINFLRGREEILEKIRKYGENYLNYSIEEMAEDIHEKYFNSKDLKEVICSIIKAI